MGAFGSGIPPGRKAFGNGIGAAFASSGVSPIAIPGLVSWHRADQLITLATAKVSAWGDLSGNGHTLSQGTDANRPDFAAGVINGQPVVRFGPAAGDEFLAWADWAGPAICTIYAVVRFRATADNVYQVFLYRDGQATPFLGSTDADGFANRPVFYTGAVTAQWTADLVDQTSYLIRWTSNANTEECVCQVNNGTAVSQISGSAFAAGTFKTLGFDPGLQGTQDLFSDVAELMIWNKALSSSEMSLVQNYVRARYAIAM